MTDGERAAAERLRRAIKEYLLAHQRPDIPSHYKPRAYFDGWSDAMFGAALNIYVVKVPEE